MIESWTKSAGGKTVTFKIEGDRKSGFVYWAKMAESGHQGNHWFSEGAYARRCGDYVR